MMDIGPGDWVECIDPAWKVSNDVIHYGGIYCVESLEEDWGVCDDCGDTSGVAVMLVGVPQEGTTAFCFCQFRPIYRPKADLIELLKEPPKRVKEKTSA